MHVHVLIFVLRGYVSVCVCVYAYKMLSVFLMCVYARARARVCVCLCVRACVCVLCACVCIMCVCVLCVCVCIVCVCDYVHIRSVITKTFFHINTMYTQILYYILYIYIYIYNLIVASIFKPSHHFDRCISIWALHQYLTVAWLLLQISKTLQKGRIVVIRGFLKDSSARAVEDHLLSVPKVRIFVWFLHKESFLTHTST